MLVGDICWTGIGGRTFMVVAARYSVETPTDIATVVSALEESRKILKNADELHVILPPDQKQEIISVVEYHHPNAVYYE